MTFDQIKHFIQSKVNLKVFNLLTSAIRPFRKQSTDHPNSTVKTHVFCYNVTLFYDAYRINVCQVIKVLMIHQKTCIDILGLFISLILWDKVNRTEECMSIRCPVGCRCGVQ